MIRVKDKKYFLFDKPEDFDNQVIQPRNEVGYYNLSFRGWSWDKNNDRKMNVVGLSKEDTVKWLDSLPFDFMYVLTKHESVSRYMGSTDFELEVFDPRFKDTIPNNYNKDSVFKSFTTACKKRGFEISGPFERVYVSRGPVNQSAPTSSKDVYNQEVKVGDEIWVAVNKQYKDRSKHIDMVKAKILSFNKTNISCEYYNESTKEIVSIQLAYDKHFILNTAKPTVVADNKPLIDNLKAAKDYVKNLDKILNESLGLSNSSE